MIAKRCTWAPTRTEAISAMQTALDEFELEGVGNNIPFLATVIGQKRFREGRLSTAYIAEEFRDGFGGIAREAGVLADVVALAAFANRQIEARQATLSGTRSVLVEGRRFDLTLTALEGGFDIEGFSADDEEHCLSTFLRSAWQPGDRLIRAKIDRRDVVARIDRVIGGFRIRHQGADLIARVLHPHVADLLPLMPVKTPPDLSRFLLCPMPGQVKRIDVTEGDVVEDGQPLAIIEAMKMENVLKAERRARVAKVRVAPGAVLAVDEVILEFEAV
jgi:propionyl-CoA carboxylase alpha chain